MAMPVSSAVAAGPKMLNFSRFQNAEGFGSKNIANW
jgi:hypothetical protein